MEGGIDPWDLLHGKRVRDAVAAHEAHPDYSAIVERAASKGFRPATISELLQGGNEDELFTRRGCGIVWVKA